MLINLDQVVLVDEATGDSCRLGLSDGTRLVLHGPGAADLASRIAQGATNASVGGPQSHAWGPACQHVSYACELMRLDSDFSAVSDELQKDRNKLP